VLATEWNFNVEILQHIKCNKQHKENFGLLTL